MFERLIFERMETRVMVGITMFVGVTLLVGWVAINEPGRMAAFDRQIKARSTERGAGLFASRCAACHGADGRGSGLAPGLNNPHLFGFDYFAAIRAEEASLGNEQEKLAAELVAAGTTDERKAEITQRLADIVTELAALDEQETALTDQIRGATLVGYDPTEPSRTAQLFWGATLHDFIYSTVTSGRPVSSAYWLQAMPAWGQSAGGPLRADQVEDLVTYVLNWDKGEDWTVEDLLAVKQFAKVPGQAAVVGVEGAVGDDVAAIMPQLETVTGDAIKGDALYHGTERTVEGITLLCATCHVAGQLAPTTAGTWTRIQNERLTQPEFADYTAEQYIVESIVLPDQYRVPEFPNGGMPTTLGQQLTIQDVADLVAYLKTLE